MPRAPLSAELPQGLANQCRGIGRLAQTPACAFNRIGRLGAAIAQSQERGDGILRRHRPLDSRPTGTIPRRRIGQRERSRQFLFQLGHEAARKTGPDPGRAADLRLVLSRNRRREIFRAQSALDGKRHFGADPLHGLKQTKPFVLRLGEESIEPDRILAHLGFDCEFHGVANMKMGERAGRTLHHIANAMHIEDDEILADHIDDATELADHRARSQLSSAAPAMTARAASAKTCAVTAAAERKRAWVIATASASAASGEKSSAATPCHLGSRTFTIMATCAFSAWPAPTTVFLTRLAAYSTTGSPASAGTTSATPRACPSFKVAFASRFMKTSSIAASIGRWKATTPARPSCKAQRRLASGALSFDRIVPLAT